MVDEALEEFAATGRHRTRRSGRGEIHVVVQTGPPGKVDHHSGQGLVQRHISVAVATDAPLVAQGLVDSLAQGDADILDRMMGVDVQIALALMSRSIRP